MSACLRIPTATLGLGAVFPMPTSGGVVASVFTIATDIHEDIVAQPSSRHANVWTTSPDNIPTPLTYLTVIVCGGSSINPVCDDWYRRLRLGFHVSEVRGVASWMEQKPYYEQALNGETYIFLAWWIVCGWAAVVAEPVMCPI